MVKDPLLAHDVELVRAANPGPLTLSGSNTWLVGRDPCWVVDPGPALDEHVTAVLARAGARGGIGGIALTHDHPDHAGAAAALRAAAGGLSAGAPWPGGPSAGGPQVGAARWSGADFVLSDGARFGPLLVVATPGHAADHLAFVAGAVCFSGDAVLGHGSAFVAPDPGALRAYLAALASLRGRRLELLCPGHGEPVTDPAAKLDAYIAHRLDRERDLVAALAAGRRTIDELLDAAWADVPAQLRPAAAITLAAHLDKLAEEDALPADVQRPRWPPDGWPGAGAV